MTIKELRVKYNLTQSALARSLGVSSNAISGIEAGRIKLSPKMSAKIKEVYGEELTLAATEKAAEAAATTPEKKTTTKKAAEPDTAPALEKKDDVESAVDEKAAEVATPAAPAPEKKPEKKTTAKKTVDKAAPKKTAEAAAPKEGKKLEKKPAPKKIAAPEKNAAAKKTPPTVILQSPFGGEITVDAVKTLVGDVDKVYVRIDHNKLYWVKGDETGDKDIW